MDQPPAIKPGQYLTFLLKGQPYGVPISSVREIDLLTDITPVPQTPAFVVGVMNLRGKIIPVVDLRVKFGMPATAPTRETCIVVVQATSGLVGVIVDAVSEVVTLGPDEMEAKPPLGDESTLEFVLGMGKRGDTVIVLIDIVSVLSRESLSFGEGKAA